MALLEVQDLSVELPTSHGVVHALRRTSFAIEAGGTLGIVGESGCGKSMTAMAIMGLLPEDTRLTGRVLLAGKNLLSLSERQMCRIRGNDIAMVFQEPMTSLNPLYTIGRQIADPLLRHRRMSRAQARREVIRLLERVGLPDPARSLHLYPHQLSGGQRQRAMIAMALSCSPSVLIADEPTTALDVTTQRQILELIQELVEEGGMALMLISHDLGVVGEMVDEILVMYGGTVVERGPTEALFHHMAHPYTRGLFAAMPKLGLGSSRLQTIPGSVPSLTRLAAGCVFAGRCAFAVEQCRHKLPSLIAVSPGHQAACLRLGELEAGM